MNEIVESVATTFSEAATGRIKIIPSSSLVRGNWDRDGVERILENLTANAIKYGYKDAPIQISINSSGDSASISVRNEGEVIPAEKQSYLFDPYHRLENAIESGQKGWGIGLTLVKALVEAHQGSIELTSTPETGTVFTVQLPLNPQRSTIIAKQ